MAIYLLFC